MKKEKLVSEDEWFEEHQDDVLKINEMLIGLEKDRRIQKLYNKFFKKKTRAQNVKYINYNNDDEFLSKYKPGRLYSSCTQKNSLKEKNVSVDSTDSTFKTMFC